MFFNSSAIFAALALLAEGEKNEVQARTLGDCNRTDRRNYLVQACCRVMSADGGHAAGCSAARMVHSGAALATRHEAALAPLGPFRSILASSVVAHQNDAHSAAASARVDTLALTLGATDARRRKCARFDE